MKLSAAAVGAHGEPDEITTDRSPSSCHERRTARASSWTAVSRSRVFPQVSPRLIGAQVRFPARECWLPTSMSWRSRSTRSIAPNPT